MEFQIKSQYIIETKVSPELCNYINDEYELLAGCITKNEEKITINLDFIKDNPERLLYIYILLDDLEIFKNIFNKYKHMDIKHPFPKIQSHNLISYAASLNRYLFVKFFINVFGVENLNYLLDKVEPNNHRSYLPLQFAIEYAINKMEYSQNNLITAELLFPFTKENYKFFKNFTEYFYKNLYIKDYRSNKNEKKIELLKKNCISFKNDDLNLGIFLDNTNNNPEVVSYIFQNNNSIQESYLDPEKHEIIFYTIDKPLEIKKELFSKTSFMDLIKNKEPKKNFKDCYNLDNKNPDLNLGFFVKIIFKLTFVNSNKDNEYILNNIIIVKNGLCDKIIDKFRFVDKFPLIKSLYISYSGNILDSFDYFPICNNLDALNEIEINENNNTRFMDSVYERHQNNIEEYHISSRNVLNVDDSILNNYSNFELKSPNTSSTYFTSKTKNQHV